MLKTLDHATHLAVVNRLRHVEGYLRSIIAMVETETVVSAKGPNSGIANLNSPMPTVAHAKSGIAIRLLVWSLWTANPVSKHIPTAAQARPALRLMAKSSHSVQWPSVRN